MRVAAYIDNSEPTGGSASELIILVSVILLGTGALPTINTFVGGPLSMLLTPLWLLLYLAAFVGLMLRFGINWISWLVRYRMLLVILLLGSMASVFWSINAQMSAERVVHLVGSSLVAVYIGFTISLILTLRVFAVVLAILILGSVVAVVAVPELGIQAYEGAQVWSGIFNSKNDLGFWAGMGVLLYITLSESSPTIASKLLCFMMTCLCLAVLVLSHSATSLVAMVVGGSLALYFYIASRFSLSFLRMAFIAVLFVALTSLIVANIETSELVGRSDDLTGRGEVWSQVIDLILEYPLTGVGFGALWFPTEDTVSVQKNLFDFTWVVYHAHNGILQIASEVGIPMAMIALLLVTQQMIEIFYCQYERRQVGVLFVLGFVTAFLVSNYSEARFLVTRELFWIFYLALPISVLRQLNEANSEMYATDRLDIGSPVNSRRYDESHHGVNEKPWLEPAGNVQRRQAPVVSSDSSAATRMVTHHRDIEIDVEVDLAEESDSTGSALALTETDIDLGGLVDDVPDDIKSISALSSPDTELVEDIQLPSVPKPESFAGSDMFDLDHFDIDIDFDVTDDWVDVDINETKP